jgi:hypothetical protein
MEQQVQTQNLIFNRFEEDKVENLVEKYILHLPLPIIKEKPLLILSNYKFNYINPLKYVDSLDDIKIFIMYKFYPFFPEVHFNYNLILTENLQIRKAKIDRIYLLEDIFRLNINDGETILLFAAKKPLSSLLRESRKEDYTLEINHTNAFFIGKKSFSTIVRKDPSFLLNYLLKINSNTILYDKENKIIKIYPYTIKFINDFNLENYLKEVLKDERPIKYTRIES